MTKLANPRPPLPPSAEAPSDNRQRTFTVFHSLHSCFIGCNLTGQQSLIRLQTVFGDQATEKTTIYNWFAIFKRGCINLNDEFRDGRPSTAMNNKNIDSVRRIIETNRYLTYDDIRTSLGIGINLIQSIVHKHLGKKNCTRGEFHTISTEVQKTYRVTGYNLMLTRFKKGTSNLVWDIVIGDDSKTKQQSTAYG
ncbi:Putative uncharacterized protein FLJ37770 [Eumeta japonica]|uniref:Mos1 transposase HTH domain-containing protein n=1 Tax=Eumeta variegata TaxID=151549 RepID=A0A4C1Z908_EUMVA|nr:Putative uncharacterized protein FLJ37770 [Eumeta japonica]